ncbi:MAG: carboxypeptidase-like regulatory domain-containing protein, partial [Bryobacteraceae bacterium]
MTRHVSILLLVSASLWGQNKGAINGDVTDASGAAIPSAKVTVKAPAIGVQRTATTNDRGSFTVPNLSKGDYEITVEAPGFKSLVRSGVGLDTDQVATLKLPMEVG